MDYDIFYLLLKYSSHASTFILFLVGFSLVGMKSSLLFHHYYNFYCIHVIVNSKGSVRIPIIENISMEHIFMKL